MLSKTLDITIGFNESGVLPLDVSGWDIITVQIVGTPSATITFQTTNDAGGVQGESDGDASTATNWNAVQGTNLTTGATVTTAAAEGTYRFNNIGRFFRLSSSSGTVTEMFLYLSKNL